MTTQLEIPFTERPRRLTDGERAQLSRWVELLSGLRSLEYHLESLMEERNEYASIELGRYEANEIDPALGIVMSHLEEQQEKAREFADGLPAKARDELEGLLD